MTGKNYGYAVTVMTCVCVCERLDIEICSLSFTWHVLAPYIILHNASPLWISSYWEFM